MFNNTHAFSGFSVNDLAAAKKFYGDALGITIEEKGEMGFMLKLAGANNVFIYPKPNHVPATFTVLNFLVHDIEKTVDELVVQGIAMERYEDMHQDEKGIMRGIAAKMGPDIAWFTDPSGNMLSVIQDK